MTCDAVVVGGGVDDMVITFVTTPPPPIPRRVFYISLNRILMFTQKESCCRD